jgi:two-component system cell cycle response regulator CpdR
MVRILIAEDDAAIRGLVARALDEDGHDLTEAADGVAALDALHGRDDEFDLLLVHLKMPVMDGVTLALAAGRDSPGMPILLTTDFDDQRKRAHDLDALEHDVIVKPFSVDQLRQAVRQALLSR